MKSILVNFVGGRDPWQNSEQNISGPILTFLFNENRPLCDEMILFHSKDFLQKAKELQKICLERDLISKVSLIQFDFPPVFVKELTDLLQTHLTGLESCKIHFNTSPGTPQMQLSMVLYALSRSNCSLWQTLDPKLSTKKVLLKMSLPGTAYQTASSVSKNLLSPAQTEVKKKLSHEFRRALVCGPKDLGKTTLIYELCLENGLYPNSISSTKINSRRNFEELCKKISEGKEILHIYGKEIPAFIFESLKTSGFKSVILEIDQQILTDSFRGLSVFCLQNHLDHSEELHFHLQRIFARLEFNYPPDTDFLVKLQMQVPKSLLELELMVFQQQKKSDSVLSKELFPCFDLPKYLQDVETSILKKYLEIYPNETSAAKALNMSPNSFRKKVCEQYGLRERKKRK